MSNALSLVNATLIANGDTVQPITPEQEIKALVARHRPEIDRIKVLSPEGQMAALRDLGIDPRALEDHYRGLEAKSDELQRRDAVANTRTEITGWASLAAGVTAALAMGKKLGSGIVRFFAVPLAGLAAGFAGTYIGSRVFSGTIRRESRELTVEAKNAFERELAVALENKQREAASPTPENPAPQAPCEALPAGIAPRDPSYAGQAAAEKAATRQTQRA
jgi:hypothetical protein